jgi:hypothetical protein
MDSAAAGDTLLVAPGEYGIAVVSMADGVVLTSEAGAANTRLTERPGVRGGISCNTLALVTEICGFWFDGFDSGGSEELGAINIFDCWDIRVHHCIFTNNNFAGVGINSTFHTELRNNTFAGNVVGLNVIAGTGGCVENILWDEVAGLATKLSFVIACNDVLSLQDLPAFWQSANFSADPLFCAPDNYHLMSDSPCAPGNSPLGDNCGLIGALPPDCSPNPIEIRSWGAVKALYRTR